MRTPKEPVRLRKKKISNGGYSLYLDYYLNGERKYEFLKMYLNPGTDPKTKVKNKVTLESAQLIQAKRLVEIQTSTSGIIRKSKITFVDYFREYYKDKKPHRRSISNIALARWIELFGDKLLLVNVNYDHLNKFSKYLTDGHRKKNVRDYILKKDGKKVDIGVIAKKAKILFEKGLSEKEVSAKLNIGRHEMDILQNRMSKRDFTLNLKNNSATSYFNMICVVLGAAEKKNLISSNPVRQMDAKDRPHTVTIEKVFLTEKELQAISNAECDLPLVKQMFMFACFTGLRYSDVLNLKWSNINDNMIILTQHKTSQPVYIPLSENSLQWMPERGDDDELIFKCPYHRNYFLKHLNQLASNAGVNKHIGFHTARHTFATLTLTYGADLYTVSRLLGHRNISTTQIYAKIVDSKKIEAVNAIPFISAE